MFRSKGINKAFLLILFVIINITFQQTIPDEEFIPSNNDIYNCVSHTNLDTCTSVKMENEFYQCCLLYFSGYEYNDEDNSYYNYTTSMCSLYSTMSYSELSKNELEQNFAEYGAYYKYAYGLDIPPIFLKYTCSSDTYTFNYRIRAFSNEEIDILKDNNYCLRLYFQGLSKYISYIKYFENEEKNISENDCFDAKLLPNSNNYCAYSSMTFKLSNQSSVKVSTCFMMSSSSFENKNLDRMLEQDFQRFSTITLGENEETIVSFEADIINKDGKELSYNSLTKSLDLKEEEGSQKKRRAKSTKLKISQILSFVLLFIIF